MKSPGTGACIHARAFSFAERSLPRRTSRTSLKKLGHRRDSFERYDPNRYWASSTGYGCESDRPNRADILLRSPERLIQVRGCSVNHSRPIIAPITVLAQRRAQGVPGAARRGRPAQPCWSVAAESHLAIGTPNPDLGRFITFCGNGLNGERASILLPAPPAKPVRNGFSVSNNVASTSGVRNSRECC